MNSLDTPDAFIIEYFKPVSQTYIIPVKGMNLIKFSLKAVVGLVETETPSWVKRMKSKEIAGEGYREQSPSSFVYGSKVKEESKYKHVIVN